MFAASTLSRYLVSKHLGLREFTFKSTRYILSEPLTNLRVKPHVTCHNTLTVSARLCVLFMFVYLQ